MRIANITFHDTANFGATLQCAALSRYLKCCGHDIQVINYLPQYVLDKKSVYKQLKKVGESGNKIKAFVKGAAYLLYSQKLKGRNRRFEDFIHQNLILTTAYSSIDDLKSNPPVADLYICGSDQIWNPTLTGKELDRAFFLQFAEGPCAAYGVSLGETDIKEYARELRELTEVFGCISVREKTSAKILKAVLDRDIEVVLDCTLLLNRSEYADMEAPISRERRPYLLLYNIQNSSESVAIAKKISEEKNLVIVDLSPNPFSKVRGAKKVIDAGPGEFLSYIRDADFVVTNSFHGTVFSIIYQRQFFTIPHKTRSGRTADLLESLGLEKRMIRETDQIADVNIDYAFVSDILMERKKDSFCFLDRALSLVQ